MGNKSIAYTPEEFKKQIYDLVGDEYTVLSDYKRNDLEVHMLHNTCGHDWWVLPTNFKHKTHPTRCPNCFGTSKSSTEKFKQEVFNLVGDEYTVLGEYINCKTDIEMIHNVCNIPFKVTPDHFRGNKKKGTIGTRCPNKDCRYGRVREKLSKGLDKFKLEVFNLVGDEYTVLSTEFINVDTPIYMLHNKCGHDYWVKPNNFTNLNRRCPRCYESKAEKRIADYLDKNGIRYEREKRFKACKDKKPLPFDFYISDLDLCIEFDGSQHFMESDFGYGTDSLENIQRRDQIKNEYCLNNNIGLIRISYKEFDNLEKVLAKDLKEFQK